MAPWRLRRTSSAVAIRKPDKKPKPKPTPGPSRSAGRRPPRAAQRRASPTPGASPAAAQGNSRRAAQGNSRSQPPSFLDPVVGKVEETRADHLKKHGGGLRTCPRCRFYKHGDVWTCSYGKLNPAERGLAGPRENVVWLAERPVRWGGLWGLGCSICAWFANRTTGPESGGPSSTQPQRGSQRLCRLGTRFARFEVRAEFLQAEHLKQHAESSAHRTGRVIALWPACLPEMGAIWRWGTSIRRQTSF